MISSTGTMRGPPRQHLLVSRDRFSSSAGGVGTMKEKLSGDLFEKLGTMLSDVVDQDLTTLLLVSG